MIDFFAPDYFTARARFRSAVLARGGQIESILLDAKGPARDDLTQTDLTTIDLTPTDLTIDIGWFGSPAPKRAFIHSSGLHGVEGFAGSAIQLQWLEEGIPEPAPDCAIALVHALNPFGMAWLRRVNENNVDLNRNFLAADAEFSGAPDDYAALDSFLNPPSPPSSPVTELFALRAAGKILHYGMPALRRAIASGQYEFPRGLFFGGNRREQGTRRFQLYISQRFSDSSRLVAIDVHTGLGRFGEDCLLVSDDQQRLASAAEMQLAYGNRMQSPDAKEYRISSPRFAGWPLFPHVPRRPGLFRRPGIRHPSSPHRSGRAAGGEPRPPLRNRRRTRKSSRETTAPRSLLPVRQAMARTDSEARPRSDRPGISPGLRLSNHSRPACDMIGSSLVLVDQRLKTSTILCLRPFLRRPPRPGRTTPSPCSTCRRT